MDLIEVNVPAGLHAHIILDNYGTHKTALIRNWFAKRPRFHLHLTPTNASWINLVERWFAEITNKRIRRGVFRSVKELEAAIREYIEVHNENPKPFVWTRTADQILESIARFAQRTSPTPEELTSRITVCFRQGCVNVDLRVKPGLRARRDRGPRHYVYLARRKSMSSPTP